MKHYIKVFYSEEDGGYIADIPDLEVCSAFGSTPEEAVAEVQRSMAVGRTHRGPSHPRAALSPSGRVSINAHSRPPKPARHR